MILLTASFGICGYLQVWMIFGILRVAVSPLTVRIGLFSTPSRSFFDSKSCEHSPYVVSLASRSSPQSSERKRHAQLGLPEWGVFIESLCAEIEIDTSGRHKCGLSAMVRTYSDIPLPCTQCNVQKETPLQRRMMSTFDRIFRIIARRN